MRHANFLAVTCPALVGCNNDSTAAKGKCVTPSTLNHLNEADDDEHGGLLRGRGLRGPRVPMERPINRIPSLVAANVEAAFQSDAFEHAADLLLSSLVSELPSNGL